MTMPRMVPDTLNGHAILRPVDYGEATPKLASTAVFHPPTLTVKHNPEPLGLLIERAAQSIVAMRAMTTSELRQRLHDFAQTVIANEARKVTNG